MKTTTNLAILTFALCCASTAHAIPVTFDWATVGNSGNPGQLSGAGVGGFGALGPDAIVGGVAYDYRISKHEVTAGQYTQFLNAVAASDPGGLYSTSMLAVPGFAGDIKYGSGIVQSGADGSYTYSVDANWENRPINYVSYFDVMRFTNWLENGQPTGAQDASTTEDGVYAISDGLSEVRNPSATYFIPSEDEWYKAAYHKNDGATGNYFDYPTSSDNGPGNVLIDPDPGNGANFHSGSGYTHESEVYWRSEVGDFENSVSPYGTFDQGGNVWEWNEEVFEGESRGLRGGAFVGSLFTDILHAAFRNLRIDPADEEAPV
ncbi:MAG: SUMF1/EgtB/PvdO family nonheme iron enzyme, partial [Pirellulales bacterium]